MSTSSFYKTLKRHDMPLYRLLRNTNLFREVPADWYVVVADIVGSTEAVDNGLHDSVNLAATGSIIAVLNELKTIDPLFKVPYFFGGDGATFLIPEKYISEVLSVLERYTVHVKDTMSLTLREGKMPVSEVFANGRNLSIAKLRLNRFLTVPVVLGLGLKYAEQSIKETFVEDRNATKLESPVDLTGMECRWDEIVPDTNKKRIVCLIVNALDENEQSKVFSKIMYKIYKTFGPLEERAPITTNKLKLNTTIGKIKSEMNARIGRFKFGYLLKNWAITLFGKYYFKYFKDGKQYLIKVSQLSDTLMMDGAINTVMSGTESQIDSLVKYLDRLEKDKQINYGLHETYASIMSCYVQDRKNNHIHFVDGTEGGYTTAAQIFKKKSLALA